MTIKLLNISMDSTVRVISEKWHTLLNKFSSIHNYISKHIGTCSTLKQTWGRAKANREKILRKNSGLNAKFWVHKERA